MNTCDFIIFDNITGLDAKALFGGTSFIVKRDVPFSSFVEAMKKHTTVVPFVPKNKDICSGYLSTKGGTQHPVFDKDHKVIPGVYLQRTKEHLSTKTNLVCFDFDKHLLLDVYKILTGKDYKIQPPDVHEVLPLMSELLGSHKVYNHLLYKSSSYGKKGKKNSHLWMQLKQRIKVEDLKKRVAALFSHSKYPQRMIGLNRQTRIVEKAMIPDMAVYTHARLLIQGNLTQERIVSVVTDGGCITKWPTLKQTQPHDMYTEEELLKYKETHKAYNKIHRLRLTAKQYKERADKARHLEVSGELYADDMVYINNTPVSTYELFIQEQINKYNKGNSLFVERTEDITCNISDVLDPVKGKGDNCYLVIRPDSSAQVYHYSEERWYRVLKRSYKAENKVKFIDKYIPTKGIKTFYYNYCMIAPTGTGKTYHIIKKAVYMLRSRTDKTSKIIWTVPDYAALNSIYDEALALIPPDIKFKALYAGEDKFNAYMENQLLLVTPDKLAGDMKHITQSLPSSSPYLDVIASDKKHEEYMKDWSFVIDEVHTVFHNADDPVNQFMYYRILQREVLFHNLIVMSATLSEKLLPGYHDRGWLEFSRNEKGTSWYVDKYNLKNPRFLTVQYNFPWDLVLDKNNTFLVMSPTPVKAVGVYQEVMKVHKDKKVLLYLGLPREASSTEIQTYPVLTESGRIEQRPYSRPSHEELKRADIVIATALTAGTSLKQAFDYCIVDMVGIPHQLEVLSTEIQKVSRARHSKVTPILVISPTRFERETRREYTPLTTIPEDMHILDYHLSKRLGLNEYKTQLLTPATHGEVQTGLFKQVQKLERPEYAVYDVLKEATAYYITEDKRLSQLKETYRGEWGLGFTATLSEVPLVKVDIGKDHAKEVSRYKKEAKNMSPEAFHVFMHTPPIDRAMDKAQQDIRSIIVPDEPTCDPTLGLLPTVFVDDPSKIVRFAWNKAFYQRMKQDAALAKKAREQNEIFCNATNKFLLEAIQPDYVYPIVQAKQLLASYIKHNLTSKAVKETKKDARKLMERLGRVSYYQLNTRAGTPMPIEKALNIGTCLTRYNRRRVNFFAFELGFFSLDDENYVVKPEQIHTPLLGDYNETRPKQAHTSFLGDYDETRPKQAHTSFLGDYDETSMEPSLFTTRETRL